MVLPTDMPFGMNVETGLVFKRLNFLEEFELELARDFKFSSSFGVIFLAKCSTHDQLLQELVQGPEKQKILYWANTRTPIDVFAMVSSNLKALAMAKLARLIMGLIMKLLLNMLLKEKKLLT